MSCVSGGLCVNGSGNGTVGMQGYDIPENGFANVIMLMYHIITTIFAIVQIIVVFNIQGGNRSMYRPSYNSHQKGGGGVPVNGGAAAAPTSTTVPFLKRCGMFALSIPISQ
jgi:hypothetical protein